MNIYNNFRRVQNFLTENYSLSKRYDEPTYFSFRLEFAQDRDAMYNIATKEALYDTIPHPLFYVGLNPDKPEEPYNPAIYSSLSYLSNANEPVRVELLKEFIQQFNNLQTNYQYYFQSIDGISELIKTDTTKGQRVTSDKRLSITCLEGLDLRMSYLMNLYRKIAWDDVYQRWVLPDMMRYFTLNIYLAEFRTFHTPIINANTNIDSQENYPLYLQVLDEVLPVWRLTCEMCEFDLNDITFEHLNNLSVANVPNQGSVKFGIKVGNIKETQLYPVFLYKYLNDKRLNAINRTKEDEINDIKGELGGEAYNYNKVASQIAQNRGNEADPREIHVSGKPFIENINSGTLFGQKGPGVDKVWGTSDDDTVNIDPTRPETWVGNAIQFGEAYAKSFVNKLIDKGKIYEVPGLGVSFSEVTAALSAKNVVGAIGLIRKGINEVVNQYDNAPSSRLNNNIKVDNILKQYLIELKTIPLSKATEQTIVSLVEAANIALSERGIWEKIKDFSLATNLVGKGEMNIQKDIQGNLLYSDEQSKATSGNIEGSPLDKVESNRVSGQIAEEPMMIRGNSSNKLSESMQESQLDRGTASANLSSQLSNSGIEIGKSSERLSAADTLQSEIDMGKSSEKLSSSIQESSKQKIEASEKLTSGVTSTTSKDNTVAPSSNLSSKLQSSNLKEVQPSSNLTGKTIQGDMKEAQPSSGLYSTIQGGGLNEQSAKRNPSKIETNSALKSESAGVRIKTINVQNIIEAESTTSMNKKIDESLKQPMPGKATSNVLEKANIEELPSSKATSSKIDQKNSIENPEAGKATSQELFSE